MAAIPAAILAELLTRANRPRVGSARSPGTAANYQNATLNIVSGRFGLPSGRSGRL
jgi:hypothetical protein